MSSCELCEVSKNTFLPEHISPTASKCLLNCRKIVKILFLFDGNNYFLLCAVRPGQVHKKHGTLRGLMKMTHSFLLPPFSPGKPFPQAGHLFSFPGRATSSILNRSWANQENVWSKDESTFENYSFFSHQEKQKSWQASALNFPQPSKQVRSRYLHNPSQN